MSQIPSEPATVVAMDADAIRKAIRRIAHEIIEQNPDFDRLVLAGIPTRGVEVARRIAEHIESVEGVRPETGIVDVSMHRDDLAMRARLTAVEASQLPFDLDGRTLILVDDVLYTGRSCRAAMDAVASFGRPARVQLAVLVDRGHRELPIRADYVGRNVPTERTEKIRVRFENLDRVPDSVAVVKS
ncbi:MAG: bifunctional pyr operon transcriptional regulator/uracil phosphoribosyltransferase PyrR [Terrimicrobiaceae bacterium]|nr:bifunctional pyr operon transcriptional regulator/uracil phosphoribosyltransferase PyrR [Terrimicrobiaceae bacterium]